MSRSSCSSAWTRRFLGKVGAASRCRPQRPPTVRGRVCSMSDWTGGGHDILFDALHYGERPKMIVEAYAPTGFDVVNAVKKVDENERIESGTTHMNGSVLVFPHGCFLWSVSRPEDVTLESLAAVILHKPRIDYLYIGCNGKIPSPQMDRIKLAFSRKHCAVEKMSISNAIGTFNILNGEDRQVAVALIMDQKDG
jgi:uncharacterized protein